MIESWSAENQERASAVIARYPHKRSAVMPLLYIASLEYGHVTEEAMRDVAELCALTPAQVQSVASFYTMFRRQPVGDYVVSVCTSISCWLRGADDVLAAIEDEAGALDGETTDDGRISVEHVECGGACGGAPAVCVNWELIEGVEPEKGRALVRWLRDARPDVVSGDEMQLLFGGQRSFDWGAPEPEGAIAPLPAFAPYGTARSHESRVMSPEPEEAG
jgi:NADH-quinone oxidoreductase subunit E